MMQKIKMNLMEITLYGFLESSDFVEKIVSNLPIRSKIQFWGDEIYFPIPVYEDSFEKLIEVVIKGDIAYWPPGNAFCIFWGPTPMSISNEIRPASPVKVIGSMQTDPKVFSEFDNGEIITIEKIN